MRKIVTDFFRDMESVQKGYNIYKENLLCSFLDIDCFYHDYKWIFLILFRMFFWCFNLSRTTSEKRYR